MTAPCIGMNGVVALNKGNSRRNLPDKTKKAVWGRLPWMDLAIVTTFCAVILAAAIGVVDRAKPASVAPSGPRILVDPGHGGADGGAVAPDGTQEKDINLAISLHVADMLRVMGYEVSMTRAADEMVDAVGDTMRERKVSDTKNRLAMVEQADLTVSIHQNKFSQSKYFGTQVFYSGNNAASKELAEVIRANVVAQLQPDNQRELKKGDSNVYLLHKATKPIALVECGFLSNEQELAQLKDPVYQEKLALTVACSVVQYDP